MEKVSLGKMLKNFLKFFVYDDRPVSRSLRTESVIIFFLKWQVRECSQKMHLLFKAVTMRKYVWCFIHKINFVNYACETRLVHLCECSHFIVVLHECVKINLERFYISFAILWDCGKRITQYIIFMIWDISISIELTCTGGIEMPEVFSVRLLSQC